MTTEQQPPEQSSQPSAPQLNPPFQTLRRPWRMTQGEEPGRFKELFDLNTVKQTRYIALDVSAETFGLPSVDPDGAIESLYERMGYDGSDIYNGAIIIIEATGSNLFLMSLDHISFHANYKRLQSYRPDLAAKRRDAQMADIDESERLH